MTTERVANAIFGLLCFAIHDDDEELKTWYADGLNFYCGLTKA